jgi:drug/metabolite transporter (DMT)-like permease
VLLVAGGTAYGSVFTANKIVIEAGFPFIAYTFWQIALAALFYVILTTLLRAPPKIKPHYLRYYVVTSCLAIVAPILMLTFGAGKLPAGVITLAVTLTPALTYIFALAVRIERLRRFSIGGVVFGFAGVALIVLPEESLPNSEMAGWMIAALLVPIAYALANVVAARSRPVDSASSTLACGLLISAAIITFPIMLIEDGFYGFWRAPPAALWGLVWAAAVQALAYYNMFEIIRRAGPVFVSQVSYVIVITGFLWALVLFDENLSLWIWAAFGMMILGLASAHVGTAQGLREAARSRY